MIQLVCLKPKAFMSIKSKALFFFFAS